MVLLHETAAIVSSVAPTRVSVKDCRACYFHRTVRNSRSKSSCSMGLVASEFRVCKEPVATCRLFCWGVATQTDRCIAWDYFQYSCTSSPHRLERRSDPQMRTVQPRNQRTERGSKASLYQDRAHDPCNRIACECCLRCFRKNRRRFVQLDCRLRRPMLRLSRDDPLESMKLRWSR